MTAGNAGVTRRAFLRSAAVGTAAAAGAAGTASAQAEPDFGGWLEGVDGGFEDHRGESEVTVQVGAEGNGGNYAFAPAGLWVDPGTEVTWEWTGQGQSHNVNNQEGPGDYQSEIVAEEGHTFSYTFEEAGISKYQCDPHVSLGMKGAVAVGDDVPTAGGGGGEGGGGGGGPPQVPGMAKTIGVATTVAMVATLGFAYFLMRFGGDYVEPESEE